MSAVDPVPPSAESAAPTGSAPPAPRRRPGGTAAIVTACVIVSALAVGASIVLPQWARAEIKNEADATLRAFLDAAITSDDAWRASASPLLTAAVPVGAPIAGEKTAAEALDLHADYTVLSLRLDASTPEYADTAQAVVEISYSYQLLGEEYTATMPQNIWLTRPFYYGDETPQQADRTRSATAVGPWAVAGISRPSADDMPGNETPTSTISLTSDPRSADGVQCFSPLSALVQLGDEARIDGVIASRCFAGSQDGADVVGAGVVPSELSAAFPAIDETDPLSIPPELLRLDEDTYHGLRAPFTQYLVGEGDRAFTVTIATANTDEGEQAVRIVGIHPVGGAGEKTE